MTNEQKYYSLRVDCDPAAELVLFDLCLDNGWCVPFNGQVHQLQCNACWPNGNRSSILRSSGGNVYWVSVGRVKWGYSKTSKDDSYYGSENSFSISRSSYSGYYNTNKKIAF